MAVAVTITFEPVLFREAGFSQAHQLVQNREFELQLDRVDHRLDRGLADVVVGEFETDEYNVHANTDAIDEKKLQHHFPCHTVVD